MGGVKREGNCWVIPPFTSGIGTCLFITQHSNSLLAEGFQVKHRSSHVRWGNSNCLSLREQACHRNSQFHCLITDQHPPQQIPGTRTQTPEKRCTSTCLCPKGLQRGLCGQCSRSQGPLFLPAWTPRTDSLPGSQGNL